jgi:hypothetical protein
MSNSPINFGMLGASGLTMGQREQNTANMFNQFYQHPVFQDSLGGTQASQQAMTAAANSANQGSTGIAGTVAGALGGADANSISATGFNPNTGNTTPTYNNLNSLQNSSANTTVGNVATDAIAGVGGVAPQVQTGSFSPNASIAAEGIFGSEESRGIQPYKKPLINF